MSSFACPRCPVSFQPLQISFHLTETHLGRVSAEWVCGSCDFSGQPLAYTISHCLVEGHDLVRIRNRSLWKVRELLHLARNCTEPMVVSTPIIPPILSQLHGAPNENRPDKTATVKTKPLILPDSGELADYEPELEMETKAGSFPAFSPPKGLTPAWKSEWVGLNGGLSEWEGLCERALKVENIRPFSKNIPSSLETVVDIVMGTGGWVPGEAYPDDAVTDISPSGILLQTESSAVWLVRLNAATRLDLGLTKSGTRVWDCLPPVKWRNKLSYSIEMEDDENGRSCVNCTHNRSGNMAKMENDLALIAHSKACGGQGLGLMRRMYFVQSMHEKEDDRHKIVSPFALFYAAYLPGNVPSVWETVNAMKPKKSSVQRALRMRPSLLVDSGESLSLITLFPSNTDHYVCTPSSLQQQESSASKENVFGQEESTDCSEQVEFTHVTVEEEMEETSLVRADNGLCDLYMDQVEFITGTTKHPKALHRGYVYRFKPTYSTATQRRMECRRYGKGQDSVCKTTLIAEMGPDDIWRCARLAGTHSEDCPRMSAAEARVWKAREAAAFKAKKEPALPTRSILTPCLADEQEFTGCSEQVESTHNSVAEESEETSFRADNGLLDLDMHQGGFDDKMKSTLTRRVYRIRQKEREKRGTKGLESCCYKDFLLTPEMTAFELGGEVFTTLHFDSGPCDPLPKTSHHHNKLVAMARKQNRTLVFKHPYAEDLLSRARIISLDGTFSGAPRAFHQTVFVLVELNSLIGAESEQHAPRWVTVAVALLSGNRTEDYQLLFTQLVALAPSLPSNLTTIYCDFEKSITKAVLAAFEGVQMAYCFFHWRDCVRRQVTRSFPWKTIKAKTFLRHLYHCVVALVFVPPEDINDYWLALLSEQHQGKDSRRLYAASWDPFLKYFGRTFLGILPAPYPQKGAGGVCKALYPVRFWNVHYRILNDQPLTNCTAQVKNQSCKKLMGGAEVASFARWLEHVHKQFTSDSLSISSFPPVADLLFPSPPSSEVTQPAEDPQLAALRSLPGFNTDSLAYQLPTNASDISSDDEDDSKLRPSTPSSEEGSDVDFSEWEPSSQPAPFIFPSSSSQPGPSSVSSTSTKNGPKKSPNKTGSKGRTWRFFARRQQLLKPVLVREEKQSMFAHLEAIAAILDSPVPEY